MGKSTISMAIFNSYVSLPEGICKQPLTQKASLGIQEVVRCAWETAGTIASFRSKPARKGRLLLVFLDINEHTSVQYGPILVASSGVGKGRPKSRGQGSCKGRQKGRTDRKKVGEEARDLTH